MLDVDRDGSQPTVDLALDWIRSVYEESGAEAYRAAVRILGDGRAAETIVETAFRGVRPLRDGSLSVATAGIAARSAVIRLATQARMARDIGQRENVMTDPPVGSPLADISLRRGGVRRSLAGGAIDLLLSAQREALELSLLEDLKVRAVADRMQRRQLPFIDTSRTRC